MQRIPAILLPYEGRLIIADFNEIICCKADKDCLWIRLKDGKKLAVPGVMGRMQEILPAPPFFLCHDAYLVNLCHARSIGREDDNAFVALDGENIPVSVEKREKMIRIFYRI